MGKSSLCRRMVEALPPDCPLRRQCDIFRSTCMVEPCGACRDLGSSDPHECFCPPELEKLGLTCSKAKKKTKVKKK